MNDDWKSEVKNDDLALETIKERNRMTEQDIRIAVAEECGWKRGKVEGSSFSNPMEKIYHEEWISPTGYNSRKLPDYPTSLDACAEFEKLLKDNESEGSRYCMELRAIVTKSIEITQPGRGSLFCDIHYYGATPIQRCEAFLRLKGKWKE